MNDVVVEILENIVLKYSTTNKGNIRLRRELKVLKALQSSPHTPNLIKFTDKNNKLTITMDKTLGENIQQLFSIREYVSKPVPWSIARTYIKQYTDAEIDILNQGYLYRDLNLEHVICNSGKIILLDHESTILSLDREKWKLNDTRGTWETMAPEEFLGYGELTTRTATYRTAVIAYLLLTGKLPYKRFSNSRSSTYSWRKKYGPIIDASLSKPVQRVFKTALAIKPIHRYKDPRAFFLQLTKAYDK